MTDRNNEHEPERAPDHGHEQGRAPDHGHEQGRAPDQGHDQGYDQGYGYGQAPRHGAWEPVPHGGEYEPDATAFVQLPPDMDMMGAPLAAPGHGYVPPMIVPLTPAAATDPGATGVWRIPTELTGQGAPGAPGTDPAPGAQTVVWPEPPAPTPQPATPTQPAHDPSATAQWNFADDPSLAGTGQWTIPVAQDELPEESGEFTTSSLIEQWGSTPPATLPGGAPAPWADQFPEATPEPAPASAADEFPPAPQEFTPEHAPGTADPVGPADPAGLPAVHGVRDDARHDLPEQHETAPLAPEVPRAPAPEPARDEPGAEEAAGESPVEPVAEEAAPEPSAPAGDPGVREAPDGRTPPELPQAAAPEPEPEPEASPEATPPPAPAPEPEAAVPDTEPAPAHDLEHPRASYVLRVNGADRPVTEAWVGESLLYVLRERLGLAGAKDGCSQGECGACNVQVDGRLVASCLVPAATTAGSEVRTVEGLATDGEPSDVQRALAESGAVQCGFCIPGMAMTVHDLLEGNHAPTELETRQALCGNLCRCSGYRGVLDAVKDVVAGREAAGAVADEARIPHQAPPGAGSAKPPHTHDGGMA
ncbi:(2Fe-2S)-binding protein [Streptomyces sp. NBC_00083]|uniref:(2Fe-2S)-binding protein n=1 Tax=Streptomyces sp. NBC_00083 TaxID=2975647 RepID=UPI002250A908|nr:2Fe-2S iron-sulfur cluster-binding protein [Streptomyces sp. NBC_00083]MCX5382160.1 2Fe-2S iron-sulfur cluster-binding protein [Streptomyces sp. NBC_00083]